MASNPYVNKVVFGNNTLIDISDTTAIAADVAQGKYFYTAAGQKVAGEASSSSGDGYVWQDAQGYVHLSDEQGTQTVVEPLSVTQNGTYTAQTGHAYSPVTVNVSGGGGLEYEEGTWTPASDVERGEVLFNDTHTEAPSFIQLADISDATTLANASNVSFSYVDLYKLNGTGIPYNTSGDYFRYSLVSYYYLWNNGASLSSGLTAMGMNSNNPTDTGTNYPRYFAKEDRFFPYSLDSRYWRAGRTYKWIAFWAPTA